MMELSKHMEFCSYAILKIALNLLTLEQLKLMFFSENKFHYRKESSVTNYYCIRSKLTLLKLSYVAQVSEIAKKNFSLVIILH